MILFLIAIAIICGNTIACVSKGSEIDGFTLTDFPDCYILDDALCNMPGIAELC